MSIFVGLFYTMKKMRFYSFFINCIFILFSTLVNNLNAQYISVNSNYTAEQLVKDIFIGQQNASCITVDNISVSGWDFGNGDLSYGYFNKNGTTFEINDGVLLSSGRVSEAVGSFSGIQSATAAGWNGDQDLEQAANINNTTNATVLEFDFISNQSNKISFEYMFLSEQYLRITDPGTCGFTDGFAFLIKKIGDANYTNLAIIPGTNTPITSNNVRGAGGKCPANNAEYFGHYNQDFSPVSFNGQTAILTAKTDVIPGEKYHIKLVIADQGNGLYDSGVILKSGSFTGNIDLGEDRTIANGNPVCEGEYPIAISSIAGGTSYKWFRNGVAISGSDNLETYNATESGDYKVEITLGSGCNLEGNLTLEDAPVTVFDQTPISICDDDFDGNYSEILSNFNGQIVQNYGTGFFNISYYTNPSGTPINPNSEFTFTQNPQTLYVKASAFGCDSDFVPIQFYYGTRLSFKDFPIFDICDDDLSGNETVNLADYINLITDETGIIPYYYKTENEAKSGGISTISSSQDISADNNVFFIRIEKNGFCPNYTEIKFNFKQPKKSATLSDQVICKGTTTDLDAGSGFDSYEWNTGETTQNITNVPVGNYWVKLGFNGCIYQQFVNVTEAEEPTIDSILINGNSVTILVSGAVPPYQYALDNGNYQSSNIFTNLEMGNHTVYVKSADGCSVVMQTFVLIDIKNLITPNGDGINDKIDYSGLLTKSEPKFEIYDRNGILVFKGDRSNRFIWDGKFYNRSLPTASYWYILEWTELSDTKKNHFTGWILLKNRN